MDNLNYSNYKKKWMIAGLAGLVSIGMMAGCSKEQAEDGAKSIGDQVQHQIIGIDPGAGLMKQAAQAIEDYELKDWKLVEGSGAAMAVALEKAYKDQKPIIVTGWTPHWKFAKYDLKYLEDPKGTFGQDEEIRTIVRQGLKDSHPSAYAMLERFEWTPDDMAVVMSDIIDGKKPEAAAADWVSASSAKVQVWTKDLAQETGKKLKLAYVAWDSEIASTHVVAEVLKQLGYQVELLQVEAGPMWAGVADGSADAMVAAWLPTTHQDYMDKYKDKLEDLGVNLKGTKLGLVVPAYMDITSIEDLK
ncbi:MAG: glycine/betaine transporter [Paenibacillaceae bacterium]|jgi:glycine betaine/proline transport system substrate-binding protein|nr:glycine/betaine transporter [Paenibacillaceae bacterium]